MKIRVDVLPNSMFSAADIVGLIDFISFDAEVDQASFESDIFAGIGNYQGLEVAYGAIGSGFAASTVAGDLVINRGTLDTIIAFEFDPNADPDPNTLNGISFSNLDIDMSQYAGIIESELAGTDVTALEDFLLNRAWDINLGGADDFFPRGAVSEDNVLLNLTGNDAISGGRGNDVLFSGDGADRLEGGLGEDDLDGGAGNDRLFGGNKADVLKGGGGKDQLFGENGKDVLFGGGGADILAGGRGNDKLSGGNGFDTFVFEDLGGADSISAFDLDNRERIDLSAVTEITGFSDLRNNHMKQVGNQTVIDDGAGTRIVLFRIDMDDLGAGDFIF